MKSLDIRGNVIVNRWTIILTGKDIIQPKYPITGGKSLMKCIVNECETRLRELVSDKGDTLLTSDFAKFYPVFKWEGDDLILDNSGTFLNQSGTRKRPEVLFGTKLVEAMNWIVKDSGDFCYTRGNLRSEVDEVINSVKRDWNYVDQCRTWSELFGYTNEGLHLSSYCNWRFVYFDEAYHHAFGGTVASTTPHRSPLFVYSNVGQSMVTSNQVTDMLREIPRDATKMYYEPKHILYLPVRVDIMDIIETQLAENNGKLVDFASGVTTVTLHFKYELVIFTLLYRVTAARPSFRTTLPIVSRSVYPIPSDWKEVDGKWDWWPCRYRTRRVKCLH